MTTQIPGLRGVAVGQVYQQLSTGDRFEVTELRQARPSGGWSATLRNLRTRRDGWNWCDRLASPHFYRLQHTAADTPSPARIEEGSPNSMTPRSTNPATSSPSGEITTITTAVRFTDDMRLEFRTAMGHVESMALQSGQISEWAARSAITAETALTGLAVGDVTGYALNCLTVAREQITSAARNVQQAAEALLTTFEEFTVTADSFDGAHRALQRHQAVAEAYAANPDAGSKEFNTYT